MLERKSIFTKALSLIFIFFVILMIVFGTFIYNVTAENMKHQIKNKSVGIATAVATMIEQDAKEYKQFISTLDMDSEYYIRLKAAMEKIRSANEGNIMFLYTEVRVSDTEIMYILDGELPGTETYSPPGSIDAIGDRAIPYNTQSTYIGEFTATDKWDSLLSVYVPITDSSTGEFLGLVGVDVSIEQYNEVMYYQRLIIIGSISILILMIAATLLLSSEKVERVIVRDSLTGVFNRAYFFRVLKGYIKDARKKYTPLAVFMVDLDHFKKVNDTYGHPFGDIVLESVCNTISEELRKTDCFARYGGEEFVAALPGLGPDTTEDVLNRIRKKVESTPIYNIEHDKNVYVTISIGVTHLIHGQTSEDVIHIADSALYRAKLTRNTVAVL